MKTRRCGRRARGAALVGATLAYLAGGSARLQAQDRPPSVEDEELRKLREDADKTTEDSEKAHDKKGPEGKKPDAKTGDAKPGSPGKPDEKLAPRSPEDEARALRAAADETAKESEDRGMLGRAFSQVSERMNEFNPRMVVATDLVGRLATARNKTLDQAGKPIDDRISLREAELDLRADVDPYAKGVAIIAVAEQDPGQYGVDVEEGYFTLETLPYSLKLQAGRFRVPFGRMNALHTHDLPQTTRPYFLQDLFGEDGWNDNGANLSWLAPTPVPINLSAIVVNGESPNVLQKGRADRPAYMGRGEIFFQLGDVTWASLGGSYLFGYNDTRGSLAHPHEPLQETQLAEQDLIVKWQPDQFKSIVLIAEVYEVLKRDRLAQIGTVNSGQLDSQGNPILLPLTRKHHDTAQGFFGTLQLQPLQRWYVGVRGDWSDFDGARADHGQWAASGWLAFYTTEFLRFRVGFEHRERERHSGDAAFDSPHNDTVFFEVTWVFGSHPAEPFWVNK